jgi:hypothetical protein
LLFIAAVFCPIAALAEDAEEPAPATPPAQEAAPQAPPAEQSTDDIAELVSLLVRKYESEQQPKTAADPARVALAHRVLGASRTRERLGALPDAVSEADNAASSRLPPKLRTALKAALVATFQPDSMLAAIEQKLAETLDSDTLQTGLQWERSDIARRISELETRANTPSNRAAKREFLLQLRKNGGAPNDARARACGQADVLANDTEAVAPVIEAFVTSGVMMAARMRTQPLDMENIARLVVALRPMLREGARQVVLANCIYDLRDLTDAEFEQRLEFLRSESGGRYARGANAALRDVLLERTQIFARALLDVARELKPAPQA